MCGSGQVYENSYVELKTVLQDHLSYSHTVYVEFRDMIKKVEKKKKKNA